MIAVRKSIGLKYQSRQLATPGHVIFAYNIVQRCLSLLVWLLGVDYVLCTPCTAGSKRHRLSGSLLWVYVTISIFRGVGLSFHAFNESRPPCLLSDHVQYKPTMSLCISVYMFVRFVGTDDLRSEVEHCIRTLSACAV